MLKFLLKSTLLVLSVSLALATPSTHKLSTAAQKKFMKFMIDTREASQNNPGRSLECFAYYVPILNDITEQYEANYAACLKTADADRSSVDSSTQPQRDQIEMAAELACDALSSCTTLTNSEDYFNCFVDTGSENTKTMYIISANASDALTDVREQYRLIDNNQYRCTNNSERVYVEDTAATYGELQSCLMGLSPVPSTPEVTTTTEAQETSTPEMSTESSESTDITETTDAATDSTDSDDQEDDKSVKDLKWREILKRLGKYFQ